MTKQVTTLKIDNLDTDTLAKIQAILESQNLEYTQDVKEVHTANFDSLLGLDKDIMSKAAEQSAAEFSIDKLSAIKERAKKSTPALLDGIL